MPPSDELRAMADHFERMLVDLFPERRFCTSARVLVTPGTFYYVDRSRLCFYISWYCTSLVGFDRPIARLMFKPQTNSIDVELPISVDDIKACLGVRKLEVLKPVHRKRGAFITLCRHLKEEGLGIAAETIKLIIQAGKLQLPAGER